MRRGVRPGSRREDRNTLTGGRGFRGYSQPAQASKIDPMKAILQAALAAALSGILVGILLKKKVTTARTA